MNEETTVGSQDNWSQYEVSAGGCVLHHPPDWTRVGGMLGTIVALIAPPRGTDTFRSNLNVVIQVSEGVMSQDECVGAQLTGMQTVLDGAIVLESEATPVGDRPGARALAAYHDGELELTLEQWMVPIDAGTLVLSATALTSDFPHDAAAFRAIAGSLTFDD